MSSAGDSASRKQDAALAPFRAGYWFGFFNATTWQVAIGTPMVLFAERLGATPLQVGLAYSFVFLLTPIQVLSTSLLARYGYKRVMLAGWSARSVFIAAPIVLALLAERLGPQAWMAQALVASVFFFCFFRSIGSAAIVPWLYTILPESARGRYFGTDQFISGLSGVGILITSAILFATLPVHQALVTQYSIALVGSICSFFALSRLPDAPPPPRISLQAVLQAVPGHLFRRSDFRRYVWLSVWFAAATTSIPPFAAYYLTVAEGFEPGRVMLLEVLRFGGVITMAALIRRRIDLTGAKPFFVVAMGLQAAVAVYWWLLLGGRAGPIAGVHAAYFTLGLSASCWTLANLNYLAKVTEGLERTLLVAIYGAVTAVCGGLAPILWGGLMKTTRPDGGPGINPDAFQWFFVTVLVSTVLLSSRLARLPEDQAAPAEPLVIGNAILRPFRAATYLVSLIDVRGLPGGTVKPPAAKEEKR